MKTIYLSTIIIAITIALGLQSCQDKFLELEPRLNKMEGNSYITENDAFLALVSVYDVQSQQVVLNFEPLRADIYSDDEFTGGEPPSGGMRSRWQMMETSTLDVENATSSDDYKRLYQGIYKANQYIKKEAGINWTDASKRKRFMAEVKFFRAYFYWDLVRYFGWVPLVTDIITPEEALNLKQSDPEVIYQYIAKNLLEAIPDLPETVIPSEYGRVTKAAAQVLMARIYQYYEGFGKGTLGITSDWSDGTTTIDKAMVKAALEEIISKGHYSLLPNYGDIQDWENENNKESIFEIQYSEKSLFSDFNNTDKVNGNTMCYIVAPRDPRGDTTIASGWSFGTLTWSLYKEFEPGDPRLKYTVYNAEDSLFKIVKKVDPITGILKVDTLRGSKNKTYTPGFHNTGYFNAKYIARTKYQINVGAVHNYRKNFIDMRLAEVYLILAELYLTDDNAKATNYLNTVRVRAMGITAAKTSITLDDVYHEKRVEFACEGLRYWDLLRRGLDYAKEKIDNSYVPDPLYPAPTEFVGFVFNKAHMGMIPIPASEIRTCNEGVLEQKIPFYK